MEHICLSSYGGSGENGRNCHVIETSRGDILLDCGVMREIRNGTVGFYPALTKERVEKVRACFLSHCHEDHVAALPLLYQLGYRGKIYASAETIRQAVLFINKWIAYAQKNGGSLPYEKRFVDELRFEEIKLGTQVIEGIQVEAGRSGHVQGGVWYCFLIGHTKILYTGDMCREPVSIAFDRPGSCDAAIMNAAYAGKTISQQEQYGKLLRSVTETLDKGGKVLLPVPPKGRGIDLLVYLKEYLPDAKICADHEIVDSMEKLKGKTAWIAEGFKEKSSEGIIIVKSAAERKQLLGSEEPAVFLAADGMLTTRESFEYFEALCSDPDNKLIATGHAAAGTPIWNAFDDAYRKGHGVKMQAEKLVIKVHMDDKDILDLCEETGARDVLLFHSDAANAKRVKRILAERMVRAETLTCPEKIEISTGRRSVG